MPQKQNEGHFAVKYSILHVLKETYDSIVKDFDQYEQVIEHVKQRRAEKEQDKSVCISQRKKMHLKKRSG